APVCGNGVVESGEQCDDGAANGTAGDCCSASCRFLPVTTVCRPQNGVCDVAETCNGAGVCPADGKMPDGTGCSDGNVCNGAETCQAGVCSPGMPLMCDDGNPCTVDTCDTMAGCMHTGMCVDLSMGPDLATGPDLAPGADLSPGPD